MIITFKLKAKQTVWKNMMMISLMIIVLGVVFCTAVDVTVKGPSSEICEDETTRQLPVLITTTQTIIVNDTLKPNDGNIVGRTFLSSSRLLMDELVMNSTGYSVAAADDVSSDDNNMAGLGLQRVGCHELGKADTELSGFAKIYNQMRLDLAADFKSLSAATSLKAESSPSFLNSAVYYVNSFITGAWNIFDGALSVLFKISLIWSDAVFEVRGIPPESISRIVLAQKPIWGIEFICGAYSTVPYPISSWLRSLTSLMCPSEDSYQAHHEFVLSQPCTTTYYLDSGGQCDCIENACFIEASPFRSPCLLLNGLRYFYCCTTVSSLTAALLSRHHRPDEVPIRFPFDSVSKTSLPQWARTFFPTFIPTYPTRMLIGMILLSWAEPLSTSTVFHYVLSAVFGTTMAALFAAYLVLSIGRQLVNAVPGAALFQSAGLLALFSAPFSAVLYGGVLSNILLYLLKGSLLFWEEGIGEYAWAGKAYFICSAVLGLFITWRFGLFNEPEDMDATLANRWGSGRTNIRRIVSLAGIRYLLLSSSDLSVGVWIALFTCYLDQFLYWRYRFMIWKKSSKVLPRSKRVSSQEFSSICDEYTRKELDKLKAYGQANRDSLKYIREENQLRMDRFLRGFPHIGSEDPSESKRRKSFCLIQ